MTDHADRFWSKVAIAGLILPPGPESKGRPIKRRKSTP